VHDDEPLEIKKQAHFDQMLAEIIPLEEHREEVERAIRFGIRIPGMGKRAGIAAPLAVPLYGLPILRSAFSPPLIVYYCQLQSFILLMSVRVTEDIQE